MFRLDGNNCYLNVIQISPNWAGRWEEIYLALPSFGVPTAQKNAAAPAAEANDAISARRGVVRFDTSADQSAALVPAPFSRHIRSGRLFFVDFIRLDLIYSSKVLAKSLRWDVCVNALLATTNHVTSKPAISSIKGRVNYITSGCPFIIDRSPLNTLNSR
jgi:hypothetical protein